MTTSRAKPRIRAVLALLALNALLLVGTDRPVTAQEQYPNKGVCGYCIQGDEIFNCCQLEFCQSCCSNSAMCN